MRERAKQAIDETYDALEKELEASEQTYGGLEQYAIGKRPFKYNSDWNNSAWFVDEL